MKDVASSSFWENVTDIIKITLTHGFYPQDAVDKFYTLYPVSIPFIVLGMVYSVYRVVISVVKKTFHPASLYLFFYISGLITIGLTGTQYVYRANSFFICYLYFWISGIALVYIFLSVNRKPFATVLACSYLLWTASFKRWNTHITICSTSNDNAVRSPSQLIVRNNSVYFDKGR